MTKSSIGTIFTVFAYIDMLTGMLVGVILVWVGFNIFSQSISWTLVGNSICILFGLCLFLFNFCSLIAKVYGYVKSRGGIVAK